MSSYHVYNGELVGVGSEERPAPDQCSTVYPTRTTDTGHCQWRHGDIIPQIGISPAQPGPGRNFNMSQVIF